MAIPNLQQRLFAGSGRATLADLPMLYYEMDPAQADRARAQGAGQGADSAQVQQLAALDAAGGGAAGGGSPGGGPGFTFPGAEAIAGPGRTGGGNALRGFVDDRGRSEGGGFTGANNMNAVSDRYSDVARRGTAPMTAENMGILAGNMTGLMSGTGALTTGFGSMGELGFGLPAGTLGGIQPFVGHQAITNQPRTFSELMQGIHEAEARRVAESLKGSAFDPRMTRDRSMRRATGQLAFGGSSFGGQGGGGGGFGGSYGGGDRTSKGPGGTLGHI